MCWVNSWSFQYKKDTDLLGLIQQQAEKVIKALEHLYEERLRETNAQGGLISVYEYLKGEQKLN